eukprot:GFYU01002085.1.p4 GENE.GFYU01002085.1~~GFYU01002085.1.p4  ORF type:complete len:104 (-),score=40.60 GFYU01002085.1:597-908(-)
MGKAKPTKHTAKEIAGKHAAATTNKGGGAAGVADRKGGKAGHSKFVCPHCKMAAPSIKSMEEHHDSKHSKLGAFDAAACTNAHEAAGGVTTAGVGVRGSTKKK